MPEREVKFNGKNLKILYRDDSDQSVIDEFFVDKMYRSAEFSILNSQFSILDIGAHIGIFSIYASVLNPQSQIIALEPEPNNYKLLKENLKLNNLKNITPIQSALITDNKSSTKLYLSKNTHNHSTNKPTNQSTPITVPAINLERLMKEHKIKKIGLLKMDIEGAEFKIISNIQYPIFNHIKNLVLEYHPAPHKVQGKPIDYLISIIKPHGFSVEHFPNKFDKRFGLLVCRNKR